MVEVGHIASLPPSFDVSAIDVSPLDVNLLDATVRLLKLLYLPQALILMPIIIREIIYRLLIGDQVSWLRHMTVSEAPRPLLTYSDPAYPSRL